MNTILLKDWKFHYNDCPDGWFKGYEDKDWEDVCVPHDWSVHMPFSKDYSSGTGYLAGGISWYRTSFYLPKSLKGKQIFITFDGVYKNSQVWCNSYYLGKRPFGYSTFRYNITSFACFGDKPNLISVRVDHKDIADSRWFTGSGITRKVTVHAEEAVHPEFNGIFFKTPVVNPELAEIEVSNTIINAVEEQLSITVDSYLVMDQVDTFIGTTNGLLLPLETAEFITQGTINNPKLWSVDTPYLYDLKTTIRSFNSANELLSEEDHFQKVGIRSFTFDANKGFFLNGEAMKLKGVCLHHDAGCLGAAVLPLVWYRRLSLLKEMGCNSIRMSHNPHMPELYDLCDALGFLVMDEAFDEWEGPKNKWWNGHNVYPPKLQGYYEDFHEWHEKDLTDLIKRDRNHPSIIMWSIGNEIDYPNDPYCHPLFDDMTGNNDKNKPASERVYNENRPNAERLSVIAKKLTTIVKKHDLTRPVTAAVAFPELSTHLGYIDSFDVVGYNYKEQFYDEDHKRFPDKPLLGSENSHSLEAWKAVRDKEYISGQYLWTGIDYLGEAAGWPVRGARAGVITTAGFPKNSYYQRQSFWSNTPMIYLTTLRVNQDLEHDPVPGEWKNVYRSWNYEPSEQIEVRCYTNLVSAELFINQVSQGKQYFDDQLGYIVFTVPYAEGTLSISGYNAENEELATDSICTINAASQIQVVTWSNPNELSINKDYIDSITTGGEEVLEQLEVRITDLAGHTIINDSTLLTVEVTDGVLLGIENGNLADCTEYSSTSRRAYEGRLLIYVKHAKKEKAIVVMKADNFKTVTINL